MKPLVFVLIVLHVLKMTILRLYISETAGCIDMEKYHLNVHAEIYIFRGITLRHVTPS